MLKELQNLGLTAEQALEILQEIQADNPAGGNDELEAENRA